MKLDGNYRFIQSSYFVVSDILTESMLVSVGLMDIETLPKRVSYCRRTGECTNQGVVIAVSSYVLIALNE